MKRKEILIVEDSRTQAEILKHLLESSGYSVIVTNNGNEALSILSNIHPDIILTDIIMPEMTGYELCARLKNDPLTKDIPVILVTQLFDPGDVIQGLASGADSFIIKPYKEEYLLDHVSSILTHDNIISPDYGPRGVHINISGKQYEITADRHKILNILLSTYEIAIRKNNELLDAKDRIATVNDQLLDANDALVSINKDLSNEITERKRIEHALSQANKKLSLLSSITRHDLKNTLMGLLAYNEIAQLGSPDEVFKKYLTRESDLLSRLSAQIEFTRLYEELGVKGAVWIKAGEMIQNISRAFQKISTIISPDVMRFEIFVDPLIEKVFYNLFDNSVRHGEYVKNIRIDVNESDDGLELMFTDDGVGIDDTDKEKIFNRGYGKNTGLGLFLVREILSITEINIKETGKKGEGACFILTTPKEHFRLI
jgi:two-component system, sensor histidine kinase and response regulator